MLIKNLSARHIWLFTPVLVALYVAVAGSSGLLFASYGLLPPPIWLASAISVSAQWRFGRAAQPGIFLGTLLAYMVLPGYGISWPVAMVAAAGELAGVVAANRLLTAKAGTKPPFGRLKQLQRFLLGGGLLFPLLAATAGSLAYAVAHPLPGSDLFFVWLRWTLAVAAGVMLFAPLLMLLLSQRPGDKTPFSAEAGLAMIATVILAVWVYWFADRQTYDVYALPYLVILTVAWSALKFDLRIAIAILLAVETIAVLGTLQGSGGLHATGDPHPMDTLLLIILATSASVYVANVLVYELRRQHRAQRLANRFLSSQVAERTEKLAASEARFRSYFNAGLIGLGEIAPDGRWVLVNNHLRFLLGYPPDELTRMSFSDIIHPADRALNLERFDNICQGRIEAYTLELHLVRKNERTIPALLSARAARRPDGTLDFIFVVIDDISQHKAMEAELKRQATVDYLTGLSNRRHFTELANREIDRAQRLGSATAFLIFDVDRFKGINDNHGHLVGDAVLKQVAALCRESLRNFDIIGRVGGEEFAVLLPNTELTSAIDIAERLRRATAELHLATTSGTPAITISIGVALRDHGERLESLYSRADAALYRAKQGGRNRIEVAAPAQGSGERRDGDPPDQEAEYPPARA